VQQGKKESCVSSTKKFTEVPGEFIERHRGQGQGVQRGDGSADLRNVDQEWIKWSARLQPQHLFGGRSSSSTSTASSGTSSTPSSPGVERASSSSSESVSSATEAHLFAQRTLVVLPCETEIDASDGRPRARIQALRDESAHVRSAGPFHADHFEYDKSRMSWHIICGIIQTQNQSAMYFTDVLRGAQH
jgi:hypothetical protein